ncbi:D-alanyl-D-alanine carboxypeptidase DacB [bacterium HR26]|nr:D-alanyl-D-alanine carboxypeptidase DacB [bacterium HR26]
MTGGGTFRRAFRLVVLITLVAAAFGFESVPLRAAEPDIAAQSAIVIDAGTGAVLYARNPDEPWAPASLTKIAIALVALESAPLDQRLTVEQYDLVGEASMGLAAGDELTLETALYGLLLPSGNDAAMTIARNLGALPGDSPKESVDRFMRRTNLMLERMGLRNTYLLNPHGLDQPGHRSTARDLALVTREALQDPTFRRIIGSPIYQDGHYALQQSNRLLGSYPGLIGGKTGITDGCGYCLMEAAERDGRTVIAVLLGSTAEAWYQDAETLLDYGFAQLAQGSAGQPAPAEIQAAPARSSDAASTGDAEFTQTATATGTVPSPTAALPSPQPATGLIVRREAPDVAVVHPAAAPEEKSEAWRWPVSALLAMGAALALVTTYPTVLGLGSLLWQRRQRARRCASEHRLRRGVAEVRLTADARARGSISTRSRTAAVQWQPPAGASGPAGQPRVVTFNAAEAITSRAIKLARRGDYHAAESEFRRALRVDASYDFTRCPGFWSMPPAGYVLAARAYRAVRRGRDARTLLTVVRLSFGSTPLLEAELDQASAIAEPPDSPVRQVIDRRLARSGQPG